MKRYKKKKIIKDKNRKRQVKWLRKWHYGVNFILDFMMKMETISKNHCKVQHKKQALRKKLSTTIFFKSGMGRNMDLTLTKNLTPKQASSGHLFEMRKRKHKTSEFESYDLNIAYILYLHIIEIKRYGKGSDINSRQYRATLRQL